MGRKFAKEEMKTGTKVSQTLFRVHVQHESGPRAECPPYFSSPLSHNLTLASNVQLWQVLSAVVCKSSGRQREFPSQWEAFLSWVWFGGHTTVRWTATWAPDKCVLHNEGLVYDSVRELESKQSLQIWRRTANQHQTHILVSFLTVFNAIVILL